MKQVILYSTQGCHLCEQAAALMADIRAAVAPDFRWVTVDIAESDELIARYGERIPVVSADEQHELGWPFSFDELKSFLQHNEVLMAHPAVDSRSLKPMHY